jgi:hypothetical protein
LALILFAIFLVFRPQRWSVVFGSVIGFDIVWTAIMATVVGLSNMSAAFLYFLYLVITGLTLASIGNAIGIWGKSKKTLKKEEASDQER